MNDFVITGPAQNARAMAQTVIDSRKYSRIGQIIGEPGTGKSALTTWLAGQMGAIRVEAWRGITEKTLAQEIATALNARGAAIELRGTSNAIFNRLRGEIAGVLIIVDEANHLSWTHLEMLRGLSDIGGAGVILVGTDMLARTMDAARTRTYLAQLRQRIGAKRIVLSNMDNPHDFAAHVIAPRFGQIGKRTGVKFHRAAGGNWRAGLELGDACARAMAVDGLEKLTETVVDTAAAWMAGQS